MQTKISLGVYMKNLNYSAFTWNRSSISHKIHENEIERKKHCAVFMLCLGGTITWHVWHHYGPLQHYLSEHVMLCLGGTITWHVWHHYGPIQHYLSEHVMLCFGGTITFHVSHHYGPINHYLIISVLPYKIFTNQNVMLYVGIITLHIFPSLWSHTALSEWTCNAISWWYNYITHLHFIMVSVHFMQFRKKDAMHAATFKSSHECHIDFQIVLNVIICSLL